MQISKNNIWQNLSEHKKDITSLKIKDLFNDQNRFSELSVELNNILFDFSKQLINKDTLKLLLKLLEECNYKQKISAMFNGEDINHTEKRKVFHVGLRAQQKSADITDSLERIKNLVDKINNNNYFSDKKAVTDIISIGIGGSDLGPRMTCEALDNFKTSKVNMHFISNVDNNSLQKILNKLNANNTIAIINSKSFTTIETLTIANIVKSWFDQKLNNSNDTSEHLIAVTANKIKAIEFGIDVKNIFEFWDWVGGRYSVWSAVGLPLAISIGMDNFNSFLNGAAIVDEHFQNESAEKNIPILMALIGVWNNNFLDSRTLAVMPYLDNLKLLPEYLQQLEMESNGKTININGNITEHHTAPIIWGGVGCNNQHAYMQLLHQGSQTIPTDFILPVNSCENSVDKKLDNLLYASCLGQSLALMQGNNFNNEKQCIGNKPSTTIVFPILTPSILGSIIAIYEHKVFIQGIIWQIQSFDQWGVELGKNLIKDLLPMLTSDKGFSELDSSTHGLLQYYQKHSKI